jgi:putative pyruvate formate lyase activating enzyme
MDQYRPEYAADPFSPLFDPKYSDIARYPTREEIETAYSYARKLGIKFELTTFY